jgi:hypothetical protein
MSWLIVESYILLFWVGALMRLRGLPSVYALIRSQKTHTVHKNPQSCETLCRAMDLACIFHVKKMLCLQRSSATALLLRRHGLPAEMVIGAQILPFKSHAWIEVDGSVVNDKPYIHEIYRTLERC